VHQKRKRRTGQPIRKEEANFVVARERVDQDRAKDSGGEHDDPSVGAPYRFEASDGDAGPNR
jgi:hypothetical protein